MGTHNQNQPAHPPRLTDAQKQSPVLRDLREKISRIEQSQTPFPENSANWLAPNQTISSIKDSTKTPARTKSGWNFDIDEIDDALAEGELNPAALHEIKPETYQDSHAAISFALALAGRKLMHMPDRALLWCLPPVISNEFGAPYGPGLHRLIPRPENCLITQPRNQAHLLWAIEEGLSASDSPNTGASSSTGAGTSPFGVVLVNLKTIEPTPARRLKLRAGQGNTPALLLTHHDTSGISMAETRWRIARAESESGAYLEIAPGRTKWSVTLERGGRSAHELNWIMEWHHETHSFNLASSLANRAPQATRTRLGSG